jgi:uncharacterized protein (TIGR03083 family)
MRMHTNEDVRPLHRIAVLASVDVVSAVTADDLAKPTPCAGWNLADLLAHMTVQHRGFAAAARGHGADESIWQPAIDAFARDGVRDSEFALPEFGPGAMFPAAMAIGFHYVDYVVHGWDVARTLGLSYELPVDVVAAALPLALVVPDGDFRTMDNAPFGPAIPSTDPADDLDRILTYLGRPPQWQPTVVQAPVMAKTGGMPAKKS